MASFKPPSPGKTPTKVVTTRLVVKSKFCVVCNRDLRKYTNYNSINNEQCKDRISTIVNCSDHVSSYICGPCMRELKKIEGADIRRSEFVSKYATTKEIHASMPSTSGTTGHHDTVDTSSPVRLRERTKRMATQTPPKAVKARRSLGLSTSKEQPALPPQLQQAADVSMLTQGVQNLNIMQVSYFYYIDMCAQTVFIVVPIIVTQV